MSLNLRAIKEALATQVRANLDRQTTVRPFGFAPPGSFPCVTMTVTDITYFTTMGPNGTATVLVDLILHVDAADEDNAEIVLDDFMSVGTGNLSSIADAVNADTTLGGVVDSCKVLEVRAPVQTPYDWQAVFPLQIITRKAGAQA